MLLSCSYFRYMLPLEGFDLYVREHLLEFCIQTLLVPTAWKCYVLTGVNS
jgi:hypothetical protein